MRAFCLALCFFFAAAPAEARRVALVIGAEAYDHLPSLEKPHADAAEMAGALRDLGYEVMGAGPNPDFDAFDAALARFYRAAEGAEAAVFYFSGHGAQDSRAATYLFPVDADIAGASSPDQAMARHGFDISVILGQMQARAEVSVMLLDSCRNTASTKGLGGGKGISFVSVEQAQRSAPGGSFVGFAAQADSVAFEGEGRLSLYTAALVEELRAAPEREISLLHRAARVRVVDASGGMQRPDAREDLQAAFSLATAPAYIRPPRPVAPVAPVQPVAPVAPVAPAQPASPARSAIEPDHALCALAGQHADMPLREGPSHYAPALRRLQPGAYFRVLRRFGDWVRVADQYGGVGWLEATFACEAQTAEARAADPFGDHYICKLDPTGDNYLSFRSVPRRRGDDYRIGRLGPNLSVQILEQDGRWRRIRLYDGRRGWAHSGFLCAR